MDVVDSETIISECQGLGADGEFCVRFCKLGSMVLEYHAEVGRPRASGARVEGPVENKLALQEE